MPDIAEHVVAVTGGTSGIGEAVALELAGRGTAVVLGARGAERLEALAARITSADGRAAWRATDVRRREDLEALVALAIERFGRLDALVSNAGVMPISPLDDLRVEDWDRMIDVNLRGVLHGIAAALPVFRRQASGHFVHLASTAAHRTVPDQAVYAGTKTAVRTISEGLRQEAGEQLRVTVVSPGMTATDFTDGVTDPAIAQRLRERAAAMAMPPAAVARAVAFALEQPADIDVGEIVVRPTAQA